jgi:hypothetical protein
VRAILSGTRGQTATEYIGLLLAVSVIIAVLAQADLPARMGAATVEQICRLVNDARDCPAAEKQRRRERTLARKRAKAARDTDADGVPDRLERRRGLSALRRDTDGDGIDDAAEIRARAAAFPIPTWEVCRRAIGKQLCDFLKNVDRVAGESARFAVGVVCVDLDLCWKAAITLGVVPGDARESWAAVFGQALGSTLTPAAIADLVKQIVAGKPLGSAIAIAGLIPLLKTPKVLDRIGRYVARNPRAATQVVETLGTWLGRDSAVLRHVLSATIPGYRRLRAGNLSHDGVLQLMRTGNDIRYLSTRSRVLNRDLGADERKDINDAIRKYWRGAARTGRGRAGAYGHEAALAILRQNREIEILYTGRRGPKGGPDIIARNRRTGRTIIVEAKGTFSDAKPLNYDKLNAPLESGRYLQPGRAWLTEADKRGWIDKLAQSSDRNERRAAAAMRDIVSKNATYDVSIIQTRRPGAQAYGGGVDKAVREYRQDPKIGDVAIVDVDAGARLE